MSDHPTGQLGSGYRPAKAGLFASDHSLYFQYTAGLGPLWTLWRTHLSMAHIWKQSLDFSVCPGDLDCLSSRSGSRSWLTCAGVPGLDEPPDDGVALVTGLLDTLALLLVEAVLKKDPNVGLILIGVLQTKSQERSQ